MVNFILILIVLGREMRIWELNRTIYPYTAIIVSWPCEEIPGESKQSHNKI